MMEDAVNYLASLEAMRARENVRADVASAEIDVTLDALKATQAELMKDRAIQRRPYENSIASIMDDIDVAKEEIIDAWDGGKKTIKFDAGTISIREVTALEIFKPAAVMSSLIETMKTGDAVMRFVTSLKKTDVREFIGIHPLDSDIVEITSRTTVGFKPAEV